MLERCRECGSHWIAEAENAVGKLDEAALAGARSNIPHVWVLLSGCGTQPTQAFVDLSPPTDVTVVFARSAPTSSKQQQVNKHVPRWWGSFNSGLGAEGGACATVTEQGASLHQVQ